MAKEQLNLEPEVTFKAETDLTVFAVKSEDTQDTLFEISGYGLDIKMNRDKIHNMDDIEGLLEGIKNLFGKLITKDLLEKNS